MLTLQQTLFTATQSLHQEIENNPLMDALKEGGPLEPSYRWLLSHLYVFVNEGEKKLSDLLGMYPKWSVTERCRLNLLTKDLHELGIITLPTLIPSFDTIDTQGKAIGLLYVMEGSRKGGIFLSDLLSKKEPHLPIRYLKGYGETTDEEWGRFLSLLEQYHNQPIQEEIIAGAIGTFEILRGIFNGIK